MIEIEPIIVACFTGALYSIIWWSTKRIDPTKPDVSFDPIPLVATVIIGAFVGVMAAYSGSEITQMSVETQLVAYGSVIAVLERILKTLYNYLENKEW
jgi:di/tricarboxylate transporter